MNDLPAHVRQSLAFSMLCEGGQVGVAAELGYCRDDPYAVTATFRVGTDDGVRWLFARDLLIEGLIAGAGDGDIRIAPDQFDSDLVLVELRGPDRRAVLTVAAASLAEFLAATYAVVDVGEEHRAIDIDGELTALSVNDWF
jgi:hypothetical protein